MHVNINSIISPLLQMIGDQLFEVIIWGLASLHTLKRKVTTISRPFWAFTLNLAVRWARRPWVVLSSTATTYVPTLNRNKAATLNKLHSPTRLHKPQPGS